VSDAREGRWADAYCFLSTTSSWAAIDMPLTEAIALTMDKPDMG